MSQSNEHASENETKPKSQHRKSSTFFFPIHSVRVIVACV